MAEDDVLARRFEENRGHLTTVAQRILGSPDDAHDAVQEAWLRMSRIETGEVDNLRAWLTTVVSRICLDMLRARSARREDAVGLAPGDELVSGEDGPEAEAVIADSLGPALLVVLETLAPAERVAFVLHDLFGMPFEEIADVVGRTPAATRQLASRARRRVRGAESPVSDDDRRHREIVTAFLAASRNGDVAALLELLDPDVVARADAVTVASGAEPEVRGAKEVTGVFAGRAKAAQECLIDGQPGLVWVHGGVMRVVFAMRFGRGRITEIELIADAERIAGMEVEIL